MGLRARALGQDKEITVNSNKQQSGRLRFGVVGSREFLDYQLLSGILSQYNIGHIVSGGAAGADTLGIDYAKEKGIPFDEFEPDWDDLTTEPCKIKYNKFGKPYNALAGFSRNQTIVDNSNFIIAFTNGSSGTADTIQRAKKKGIPVQIVGF